MGNFGGLITARTSSLAELAEAAGLQTEDRDGEDGWDLADGWQTLSFPDPGDLSAALASIAEATGSPVVAAYFLDSDTGFVEGVSYPGLTWSGVLDPGLAEDYGVPLDDFPIEDAIRGALLWSTAAGLTTDPDLVRTAFTESRVLAEDLYFVLLAGLGIPGATAPEHSDGPALDQVFTDGATFDTANGVFVVSVDEVGELALTTGRLFACDPFVELDPDDVVAFTASVAPGSYRVQVARARREGTPGSWVVAVKVVITDEPVRTWERDAERPGYGVDAGAGCFIDPEAVPIFHRLHETGDQSPIRQAFRGSDGDAMGTILTDDTTGHTMALFASGIGDGYYPTWIGRAHEGHVTCFVTQFINPDA